MKTNYFLLLIAVAIFSTFNSGAQIIYQDIDPDITLPMPDETFGTLGIDMDGDNVDDFKFVYYNYPSFGLWNLGIQQIDTNNPKIEFLYDMALGKSPVGGYYAKVLSSGDNIPSGGDYSDGYPQIGDSYNANFRDQGPKYVGFRLVNGGSYLYGWFAIELMTDASGMTFMLTEAAFQSDPNGTINAGQQSIGISELGTTFSGLKVFPNPASDFVIIESVEDPIEAVRLVSLNGETLYELDNQNTSQQLEINLSDLKSGLYILEVKHGELGHHTQKILKY